MSPKIPRPQKRACDVCYEKKIHCSIPDAEGPCEWCENRGLECTFDRERPRKRKRDSVKPSDVQNLLERVEQLEKALLQTQETRSTAFQYNSTAERTANFIQSEAGGSEPTRLAEQQAVTTTPGSFYSRDHPHDSNVLASQLGPNWFFSGIPISSQAGYAWIATRTSQKITGIEFSIPIKATHPVSISQETGYLPDKNAVQEILSAFFDSSLKLSFPVLDELLSETTLETAYEPSSLPLSNAQIAAKACIFSTLALSPRFCFGTENIFATDVEIFASKANNLLNQIAGDTSLTLLQTALMLELRCRFNGHWLGAVPFHSIACRIVCSLAGTSNTDHERRHIQKLFWLCYMLDKDLSLRTGNPPLLTDTYCDPIPQDDPLDDQSYQIGINQVSELRDGLSEGVHLAILKGKACQLLFSARALRDNDNKLLSSIRQLDDEIERWRLSIPVNLRPALYLSQNALIEASNESIPHVMHRLSLQLDYHHLMTVIHTTVRRCTTETEGTEDLHHVVHSSFDLSLVASRSTLWCLKFLISNMTKEAYRMITFYSTTAAMALFLDIVIHPYSQQAQLDLELLISTANSVRSLDKSTLTTSEMDRVRETSSFVMRLVWLGTCAIMKGDRNERSSSM